MYLINNPILLSALLSALTAQPFKIPLSYVYTRRVDWKAFLKSGGMPSSHTALMVGLTSAIFFNYGWTNPYFAISLAITLIIMYDAAGVRRQAGEQAIILNQLSQVIQSFNPNSNEKISIETRPLKEILGHNPFEVLGGILVGIFIAYVLV